MEADIWLTNGALLVAHDFGDTSPAKTLEALYLDPLRAFARTNTRPGEAFPLTLLIDVKSDAEKTYAVLREILKRYADILTRFESNTIQTNAVIVKTAPYTVFHGFGRLRIQPGQIRIRCNKRWFPVFGIHVARIIAVTNESRCARIQEPNERTKKPA